MRFLEHFQVMQKVCVVNRWGMQVMQRECTLLHGVDRAMRKATKLKQIIDVPMPKDICVNHYLKKTTLKGMNP